MKKMISLIVIVLGVMGAIIYFSYSKVKSNLRFYQSRVGMKESFSKKESKDFNLYISDCSFSKELILTTIGDTILIDSCWIEVTSETKLKFFKRQKNKINNYNIILHAKGLSDEVVPISLRIKNEIYQSNAFYSKYPLGAYVFRVPSLANDVINVKVFEKGEKGWLSPVKIDSFHISELR